MAKVAKNIVLYGASGSLGDQLVIRQRKGQTVLSAMPRVDANRQATPAQAANRARFQEAIFYGKAQLADPQAQAGYQAKAAGTPRSAFNVAVADFFNAPNVDEVDLTGYHGAVGEPIRVRATDDFQVTQVQVSIVNADGSLLEEGNAIRQPNSIDWVYAATAANESLDGDKIVVRASDKPGHVTKVEEGV
ncbi:MAG: hypothetical protein COS37_00675 [Anaerolineae bacterium CG03_land_8_20_14_0_80_58_20]|nr:MAG: hypothetical protein AUJ21_01325 [Anaerolineae bacterium CG1_02_58_13]PIV28561.1 MAG: hypothetical protein COS37_00675 [Anaerolineae bacterium CG03_land_8_20_14_0_80_58_20]